MTLDLAALWAWVHGGNGFAATTYLDGTGQFSTPTGASDPLKANLASPTFTGIPVTPVLSVTGLTGATSASRYVGATDAVAPTSGTFLVGDYVITQAGSLYICTVAGTPGTWVQVGGAVRVHAFGADWASHPATDFWLIAGPVDLSTGGQLVTTAGVGEERSLIPAGRGWAVALNSGITPTAGNLADFLASADAIDPSNWLVDGVTGATETSVRSPYILGDYIWTQAAAKILNLTPTTLTIDVFARFTANSGNQVLTGFGLIEGGSGTTYTAANHLAFFHSDGTNFKIRSGAATSAAILAVDTNWHLFTLRITSANVFGSIDAGTEQTLALETDLWPTAWALVGAIDTTNKFRFASMHAWWS